jgi:hypothetical protein
LSKPLELKEAPMAALADINDRCPCPPGATARRDLIWLDQEARQVRRVLRPAPA